MSKRAEPKRPKRHQFPSPPNPPGEFCDFTVWNPVFAVRFAAVVTEFVHLEREMATIAAMLMGDDKPDVAGYIMRSVVSARARVGMLRSLLENAALNRDQPVDLDEIISEFDAINIKRNEYVHGLWSTGRETGRTYLAKKNPHGQVWADETEAVEEELEELIGRIRKLKWRIVQLSMKRPLALNGVG